jgi:mono/diheme cytochrome c family protein
MALSANTVIEIRAIIDANLTIPSAPPGAPGAPPDFCAIWPTAKPILQTLAGLVVLIPGFGSAAAAALTALIAAGQAIFDETCHS